MQRVIFVNVRTTYPNLVGSKIKPQWLLIEATDLKLIRDLISKFEINFEMKIISLFEKSFC